MHGVIFSLWFVVLLVQTFLIPAGRVRWHRKLGLVSYGVAALVVLFGVLAAIDSLRRGVGIGSFDLSVSFAISIMDMVAFGIVIFSSYRARHRPSAHKRLVLYATLSLMDAAFDRWPYEQMRMHFSAHTYVYFGFLFFPGFYDLVSTRRIQKSTLWAFLLIATLYEVRIPMGSTHLWHLLSHAVAE
ncbi:hypothetical protein [Terriglobus saanensis]|uniref:hypothetical protein n=1 Tax=Terriglobus saanensis TaxID=870903 RepID=UPI00165142F0|nr:hypothetical protein [Terriglobus saanensis]